MAWGCVRNNRASLFPSGVERDGGGELLFYNLKSKFYKRPFFVHGTINCFFMIFSSAEIFHRNRLTFNIMEYGKLNKRKKLRRYLICLLQNIEFNFSYTNAVKTVLFYTYVYDVIFIMRLLK